MQDTIDQTQKLEAVWKIRIKYYTLYDTGVHGASTFILAVVNNVWVYDLHNPTTFYTDVLPSALLEHLKERCTGLHTINTVNLPLIIQGYYTYASSMPLYINMLKDAQHKSQSTDLPLFDKTLLSTAKKSVFASQEYPEDSRKWEPDPKEAKTWASWTLRYKRAYEPRQIAHQDSDGAS